MSLSNIKQNIPHHLQINLKLIHNKKLKNYLNLKIKRILYCLDLN
jgi:hypothetical protein